ncbi:MAG: hypothetical protein ACJASX_002069 [Limisphaerales bacterium]|jgi:hypothetical protein
MPRILYCHCNYAQVVPAETKAAVLKQLCDSGVAFDAVADLCEMAARKDPSLSRLTEGDVKIAACYPRAVKWIFGGVGCKLDNGGTEVLNMRTEEPDFIAEALLNGEVTPNLPDDKDATKPSEEELPTAN